MRKKGLFTAGMLASLLLATGFSSARAEEKDRCQDVANHFLQKLGMGTYDHPTVKKEANKLMAETDVPLSEGMYAGVSFRKRATTLNGRTEVMLGQAKEGSSLNREHRLLEVTVDSRSYQAHLDSECKMTIGHYWGQHGFIRSFTCQMQRGKQKAIIEKNLKVRDELRSRLDAFCEDLNRVGAVRPFEAPKPPSGPSTQPVGEGPKESKPVQ